MPRIKNLRTPLITAIAIALIAAASLLGASGSDTASAADAETAQLISYFNSYRASQGVGALTTSATLNQGAQQAANDSANAVPCRFLLPSGSGKKWGAYGYITAAQLWQAYLDDPITLPWIADPKYKSVGVGRAYTPGCNYGHMWIIWLSTQGSSSTPAPTPTLAPTPPPNPTPTPTSPPNPTATPVSTPTFTPSTGPTTTPPTSETPTHTAAPTETPEPSTTPFVQMQGDVNCDGKVDLSDAVAVVKHVGGSEANVACAGPSGPDCLGGLDELDALALMRYLGGIPFDYPDGCPHFGAPVPTPTPAPTPTPGEGETPAPTPTATPLPGVSDQCWIAIVAYDMTYGWELNGDHTCEPEQGAAYTCNFPAGSNQVTCATGEAGVSDYNCHVYLEPLAVPCVATDGPDASDYVCERGTPIVCTSEAAPTYQCDVADQVVTCHGPAEVAWQPAAAS